MTARPVMDVRASGTAAAVGAGPARILAHRTQHVAVDHHDARVRRVAQMRRAFGHRLQHRLNVGRRARDHAQDLADRRLLPERVRELARTLVDLALEAGIRLAQLRRHPVELVGEAFELIVGPHDDLLVEVARADAPRPFVQRPDRAHHAAREHERCGGRDDQPAEQQESGSNDRGIELRVDLGFGLLDEHLPVEQLDRSEGRQHRRAREIHREHRWLAGVCPSSAALHVRKSGKVRLAQHQSDIGIGDEEAVVVDDVRLALVADLDPRHDVPDELEVDVGNGHRPGIATRAYGDRHVGLGLLAEVHRTEPRMAGFGVAIGGLLRAVLPRADGVQAEARYRKLLAAAAVELRDVGHFRRLAQQLEELDPAQLDVAPRQAAAAPRR